MGALTLAALTVSGLRPKIARADNPFEAEQTRLESEVLRAGRSPRALLPLLQLWAGWGDVRPELSRAALERLSNNRRLSIPTRIYAQILQARALGRAGNFEEGERRISELGFVRDWAVIGPFDNEGKAGFERAYGPETETSQSADSYQGRVRSVSWRPYPDVMRHAYVSFDAIYRPHENVCAYAETFVESERERALSLWFGAGGASAVWWNGMEVHRDAHYRQPSVERSSFTVGARAGLNRLLVKTCTTDSTWGFYLRIGGADGETARELSVRSTLGEEQYDSTEVARITRSIPRAPLAALASFEQAAAEDNASARALESLARLMTLTGADDPSEHRARQLASRAAEQEPTVARLALAARLSSQRGPAMALAERAMALAPNDPAASLLVAGLRMRGLNPQSARALLSNLTESSVSWMRGARLRAALLVELGLPESAQAVIEEAASLAPGTANWLDARGSAAGAAERRDEHIRLRQALLTLKADDRGARRILLDDALSRGDARSAQTQLQALLLLNGGNSRTYTMAAEVEEALDRSDRAFSAYRRGMEIAPEDAPLWAAYGRALLRVDQGDAARQALSRALVLRPQDAALRGLIEQLSPQERPDEAYAASEEELLARRGESEGYAVTVLQDLSVNTVFESGLGSSFKQVAVQIHDGEGARQWQHYGIQYDPDVQRVDIRQARVFRDGRQLSSTRSFEQAMGQPWYRMYYDTRSLTVVFPDLEAGDVVEVRYRIDDISPRNLFNDYYGDLHYLQQDVPVRHMEVVLMTPEGRNFYFNEPNLRGLRHIQERRAQTQVDRFIADNVPAFHRQPAMPGLTEVVPYLHISTYRSWEAVGRWYWGLIQDQLYADEALRAIVAELIEGADDVETKVARIYDWVIRNTRYVALEFGIHGFLPYRVPEVVRRGFGDCKDKASLIYTMLQVAGVDARIVLLRTRPNGQIRDLPASLAVFDHAIAYVPDLDLYLDGTAQFTGLRELPQMDQGVTVLRVGPDDVTLAHTPETSAQSNRMVREIRLDLNADGSGDIELRQEVIGVQAPSIRSRYQSEALTTERLEDQISRLFPGIALGAHGFDDLDAYNEPSRMHLSARVPQLGVVEGSTMRLPFSTLGGLASALASASSRSLPLDLGAQSSYQENRIFEAPEGWEVADVPEGGAVGSAFGTLTLETRREGDQVHSQLSFSLEQTRISPAEYPDFRRWVQRCDRVLRQRLTLRRSESGATQ